MIGVAFLIFGWGATFFVELNYKEKEGMKDEKA